MRYDVALDAFFHLTVTALVDAVTLVMLTFDGAFLLDAAKAVVGSIVIIINA